MKAQKGNTVVAGPGVGFMLFVVFLILKLCGVIAWSWLWITAPLWIPLLLALVLLAVIVLVALLK